MKEEILAFLEWAEKSRATSLCRCDGYDEPTLIWDKVVEELVDDYIKFLEGE